VDAISRLARRLGLAHTTEQQSRSADRGSTSAPDSPSATPVLSETQVPARSVSQAKEPPGNASVDPRRLGPAEKGQRSMAVITAATGLIGALIGGVVTFAAVVYQNHTAASAQLTSERRTLYASYYTALQNMEEYAVATEIYIESGYPQSIWKNEDGQYRNYAQQFGNLQVQVSLLGSERISQNVQIQQKDVAQLNLSLDELEARVLYPSLAVTASIPSESALLLKLSTSLASCRSATQQFEAYARSELDPS
jgi:hypothetical protein